MEILQFATPWLADCLILIPIRMNRKQKRYGSSQLNSQKSSVSAKQSVRQSEGNNSQGGTTNSSPKYAILLKISSKYESEKKLMLKNQEAVIYQAP